VRCLLTCASILALAGCAHVGTVGGTGNAAGRHGWTVPGTLRVAMPANINSLNPLFATLTFEIIADTFAFDPLVATDPDGKDVPILAAVVPTVENGGISADGKTVTYHLKRGVAWQDGAPFTSRDVAFTYRAIMNPSNAVTTQHGYDVIDRVDTPGPYTFVVHLKRPFAPFVHTFFAHSDAPYMILPEHLLGRYRDLNHVPFNGQPVGTGPYRVVRWLRGERIEYVANDRYFLGRPQLRKVVVHLVPDENTIVSEMRTHEIDWFVGASPRTYPQLRTVPNVIAHLISFNAVDSIMFNTRRRPFDDPRLRRAVGFAIDKKRLVADVTFGTALAATEDIPSFMWAFDPTAGTDVRNLPAARALLDASGWHIGHDGIRTKGSERLTMQLAYRTESATDRTCALLIAQMLRDAGIDVELKAYTTGVLYASPNENGILASGRYQAALFQWAAGIDPDDSSQLLCAEQAPRGYNWSSYCSEAMDAAQSVALAHYDLPTRKRAYSEIQHLLARDAPLVYLWWPRQIEAVSDDLNGFRPNGIVEDWNAWQWSI
jgi:peptide/nickel transport system substrate-binding protein